MSGHLTVTQYLVQACLSMSTAIFVGLLLLLIVVNVDKKDNTPIEKRKKVTIWLSSDDKALAVFDSFQEAGCKLQKCTPAYCSIFCDQGGRIRIYDPAEKARTQVGINTTARRPLFAMPISTVTPSSSSSSSCRLLAETSNTTVPSLQVAFSINARQCQHVRVVAAILQKHSEQAV